MCKILMYEWAGDKIRRDTVIDEKRRVPGYPSLTIPTDIRRWIRSQRSKEINNALLGIEGLPSLIDKSEGSFDKRALLIWNYVIKHIEYVYDKEAQGLLDFWQFPEESLKLGKGDCEDSSYLLASLLLASGISPFCVRAVIGKVYKNGNLLGGHAWVIYLDEAGTWRLLESTLNEGQKEMPSADSLVKMDSKIKYTPEFCLNQYHLWQIEPSILGLKQALKRKKADMRKVKPEEIGEEIKESKENLRIRVGKTVEEVEKLIANFKGSL